MLSLRSQGIIDTTLREGLQTPGVLFSRELKLRVIQGLIELGVEEIELGVASLRAKELLSLTRDAQRLTRGRCRLSLWSRCVREDIDFALQCGPDILSLSMPVSDIHITEKLNRSREWVLETLKRSVGNALDQGTSQVSVGLEDATRADPDFLAAAAETAEKAGASRLRLADTVGIASPLSLGRLVRDIKRITAIPLAVHTHNDFGMATANAVAAIESGAAWADATVLGMGERAGNCRLEEIIGYLSLQKGLTRYRPEALKGLCGMVATAAGLAISPHHPVVGERIFTCETGLHVQGLSRAPLTYEPYNPLRVGSERSLLFGSKTGKRAIRTTLDSLGVRISDEQAENLTLRIRGLAESGEKPLDEKNLVLLAGQILG